MTVGENNQMHGSDSTVAVPASTQSFSFEAFNRRIAALPDGPISVLNAPRWQRWLGRSALLALVLLALMCTALVLGLMAPDGWMVWATKCLLVGMIVLWLPGLVRSLWVIGRDMRKGTAGFMRQWDHDVIMLEQLQEWLLQHPRALLEQRLLQCQQLQAQLNRKLGLFLGSIDRWGLLPVMAATFLLLKEREALLELPGWLLLVGVGVIVFWVIGMNAQHARLRLATMEALLHGALMRPLD